MVTPNYRPTDANRFLIRALNMHRHEASLRLQIRPLLFAIAKGFRHATSSWKLGHLRRFCCTSSAELATIVMERFDDS